MAVALALAGGAAFQDRRHGAQEGARAVIGAGRGEAGVAYVRLMAALLAQQKFVATREFLTAPDGARIDRTDRPRQSLGRALNRRNDVRHEKIRIHLKQGGGQSDGVVHRQP